MEWSGVDYLWIIVMFLSAVSFWRHPFTAEDPWWRSDVMLHFSKSDEETNSSASWMAWGWVHFQHIFIFGRTTPLSVQMILWPLYTITSTHTLSLQWMTSVPVQRACVCVGVVDLLCVNSSTETDLDLQECVLVLFWDSVLSGVCRSV